MEKDETNNHSSNANDPAANFLWNVYVCKYVSQLAHRTMWE